MKYIKNKWTIIGLLLVANGAMTAFKLETAKAPQYYMEKVQKGDIQNVVQATGTINAVTTVQVGSQVSGTIQTLFADFNSHVKKNQVIAQIDPSLFKGALLQAQANLANAQANLTAAKANLDKADAAAVQAKLDFNRYTTLAAEGVVPTQQLDTARATSQSADAAVGAAKAQVTQAAAQVQQNSAAVTVAKANLDYTTIRSPIDGTVIARSVDVGQTVAASLQAPTLFTIAQDLTKMQVYAATDESDVGMIKTGQVVSFKVDAFPKDTFSGKVSQVRMNATTVQNVVTYNTIIDFDNPELKLFPGMTAYISIPVASAQNVMRVANGALRYKPDMTADQVRALYKQYGLISGDQQAQQPGQQVSAGENGGGRRRGQGGQGAGAGDGNPSAANAAPQKTPRMDVSVVWKLHPDKTLEPVRIRTGITDHTTTEVAQVLKGNLNPGDELVTGATTASASGSRPPGLGGGAGRR